MQVKLWCKQISIYESVVEMTEEEYAILYELDGQDISKHIIYDVEAYEIVDRKINPCDLIDTEDEYLEVTVSPYTEEDR